MGDNFSGIEEAMRYFKLRPSMADLEALAEIPFSEKGLVARKETHVLVAVLPTSITELGKTVERKLMKHAYNGDDWWDACAFGVERGVAEWCLICKNELPDSTHKRWNDQLRLVRRTQSVPTARVMAYTILSHYLRTGMWLFSHSVVRCADPCPDAGDPRTSSHRVEVGWCDAPCFTAGLGCFGVSDDEALGALGLAVQENPDFTL